MRYYYSLIVPIILCMDQVMDVLFANSDGVLQGFGTHMLAVTWFFVILPLVSGLSLMFKELNKSIWWADNKTTTPKYSQCSSPEAKIAEHLF